MRALVTGSGGFVGRHLVAHLEEAGDEVLAWSGGSETPDITDGEALRDALSGQRIDAVYHLAAQSRVDLSWEEAALTMQVNAGGTAQLIDALADTELHPRVIVMSSAEVYGRIDPDRMPIDESTPLSPQTPYGVSKAAAEQLARLTGERHGLPVLVCRPFNLIGPGQAPMFVTAAFAQQIVANERRGGGELRVGNLDPSRDFLDVRDAVAWYRRLMLDGESGKTYNVSSGRDMAVRAVLDTMVARSTVEQRVVVDRDRFRPNDVKRFVGSNDAIVAATGWEPTRPLEQSLIDVLDDWRQRPQEDFR